MLVLRSARISVAKRCFAGVVQGQDTPAKDTPKHLRDEYEVVTHPTGEGEKDQAGLGIQAKEDPDGKDEDDEYSGSAQTIDIKDNGGDDAENVNKGYNKGE